MDKRRTYTREEQRRNGRIAVAVAIAYGLVCVIVSVWLIGNAFDHMTDPCRTDAQRSVVPSCVAGSR